MAVSTSTSTVAAVVSAKPVVARSDQVLYHDSGFGKPNFPAPEPAAKAPPPSNNKSFGFHNNSADQALMGYNNLKNQGKTAEAAKYLALYHRLKGK